MNRQAFLRQLQVLTLTGATATFSLVANAQDSNRHPSSLIQVQGGQRVLNPVPQGYGRLNPRVPSVGQGGGQYGDPRVRTGGRVDRHNGIDLPGPVGSPVYAPVSGMVVRPDNPGRDGYGNQVRMVDADGRLYILGHVSSTNVQPGSYVNAGQQVAEVGRSGNTPQQAASHLHMEVRDRNNRPIRIDSTPANDPAGAAAGYENYLDSLPRSIPSQAPQMRAPTPPQPRQTQPERIINDNNTPRSNDTTNPAVTPRSSGVPASTANLGPAVSARRTGVESQTASLRMR
ncbi:MAG: M23 family metallopeptidase [Planctomycetes bacterium]|nr:M23 family metallopeptidase [Planctomycetota bacterium]